MLLKSHVKTIFAADGRNKKKTLMNDKINITSMLHKDILCKYKICMCTAQHALHLFQIVCAHGSSCLNSQEYMYVRMLLCTETEGKRGRGGTKTIY